MRCACGRPVDKPPAPLTPYPRRWYNPPVPTPTCSVQVSCPWPVKPGETAVNTSPGTAVASSLDPVETNRQPLPGVILTDYDHPREDFAFPPIDEAEACFRHSSWRNRRLKTWAALQATHASSTRLDRFANCGSGCYIDRNLETDKLRTVANYCHDRFCLPCATARARLAADVVACHCAGRRVRFLTLTLKHQPLPLATTIDRLFRSFTALRHRQDWIAHVTGGVAFLEIKPALDGSGWHPHLHVLIEGDFWDQRDIARAWHEITGDSFIVDIRQVKSAPEVAAYVAKYASKPGCKELYDHPAALAEAVIALKGRRLMTTFGAWRALKLQPEKPADDGPWKRLGLLSTIVWKAQHGEPEAVALWNELRSGRPATAPLESLPAP